MRSGGRAAQLQIQEMSLQQQQSLRILQMNRMELRGFLADEFRENPLMDMLSESDAAEDWRAADRWYGSCGELSDMPEEPFTESWRMLLKEQLMDGKRGREELLALSRLIDMMDDHGFLPYGEEELCAALSISRRTVERLKWTLLQLEPNGVGYRDVRDYVKSQLMRAGVALTMPLLRLIDDHFEELAGANLTRLARELEVPPQSVHKWVHMIRALNVYPVQAVETQNALIMPDLIVERTDGTLSVHLNENGFERPVLSAMSDVYFKGAQTEWERDYIREKWQRAKWVVSAVEQRKRTLLRIGEQVAKKQRAFFDGGLLYGMTQTEMAMDLGINKSTISRTVAGKYLVCSRGVFSLDSFFSIGLGEGSKKRSDESETLSRESIKALIQGMIEQESRVMSDEKIRCRLLNEGINISRRTVAKYRGELGIGSAVDRRYNK